MYLYAFVYNSIFKYRVVIIMNSKYRVVRDCIFFLIVFYSSVILSNIFLPDGFLKDFNTIKDISADTSAFSQAISIILRNGAIIFFIAIGNIIAISLRGHIFPIGYLGVILMFVFNGVTLGTWSFSARNGFKPSLFEVLLHSFDIVHNSGLIELIGVSIIVSVTGRLNFFIVERGIISKSKIRPLNLQEIISIILGIGLIVIGAVIESRP